MKRESGGQPAHPQRLWRHTCLLLSWLHGANVAAPQCTHSCTRARKGRGRVRASSGGCGAAARGQRRRGVQHRAGRGARSSSSGALAGLCCEPRENELLIPPRVNGGTPGTPSVTHAPAVGAAVGPTGGDLTFTQAHIHERKQTTANDSWPLSLETDSIPEVEPMCHVAPGTGSLGSHDTPRSRTQTPEPRGRTLHASTPDAQVLTDSLRLCLPRSTRGGAR